MYTFGENDTAVQVCVVISQGSLAADRNVVVIIESADGTAMGNYIDGST